VSPKLPRRTAAEIRSAVERAGFRLVRQSGSHQVFKNVAGVRITLPMHSGLIVHPKILRRIIADTGLTVEEFEALL
jgi:predicted RNA binding protein YcfA (HicA-like mRNA interferase family)